MAKSTDIEVARRVDTVFKLLMQGLRRSDIIRYVDTETNWDIGERQVDQYIKSATNEFKTSSKIDHDTEMGKAMARLNRLYANAYSGKDYKTCLSVQKEINELAQLIEHQVNVRSDNKMEITVKYDG